MQILDSIFLKNGGHITGIIDFSAARHLVVIDLSNNSSPPLTKRLIEWRMYHPQLRFTVFASMLGFDHPTPILINKRDIVKSTLANPHIKIKKTERFNLPVY